MSDDYGPRGWSEYLYIVAFFALLLGSPITLFLWVLFVHPVWLGVAAFVVVYLAVWLGVSWARST